MLGGDEENNPRRSIRAKVYSESKDNKGTQSFAWKKHKEWVISEGDKQGVQGKKE